MSEIVDSSLLSSKPERQPLEDQRILVEDPPLQVLGVEKGESISTDRGSVPYIPCSTTNAGAGSACLSPKRVLIQVVTKSPLVSDRPILERMNRLGASFAQADIPPLVEHTLEGKPRSDCTSEMVKKRGRTSLAPKLNAQEDQTKSDCSEDTTENESYRTGQQGCKLKVNSDSRSSSVNSLTAVEDGSTFSPYDSTSESISHFEAADESLPQPTTVKRSRGRPSKGSLQKQVLESSLVFDESNENIQTESVAVVGSVTSSLGKKRGRKPKENNESRSSSANSFLAVEGVSSVPPDDLTSESVSHFEAADESSSQSTAAKRSRGRPSKGSLHKQVLESTLISDEGTENSSMESDPIEASATLSIGKKRGRKPKESTESRSSSVNSFTAVEDGTTVLAGILSSAIVSHSVTVDESFTQITAAKKSRGRPSKGSIKKHISDSNFISDECIGNLTAESEPVEPSATLFLNQKRGCRPKENNESRSSSVNSTATVEDGSTVSADMPSASGSHFEAADENLSQITPAKKSRGRPSKGSVKIQTLGSNLTSDVSAGNKTTESNPSEPRATSSLVKKRGRKPKENNESQSPSIPSLLAEDINASVDESLSSPVVSNSESAENVSRSTNAKRPRGRPPAISAQNSFVESNLIQYVNTEIKTADNCTVKGAVTLSTGKKRGRKAKALIEAEGSSLNIKAVSSDQTETVLKENDATETLQINSIPMETDVGDLALNSNMEVEVENEESIPGADLNKQVLESNQDLKQSVQPDSISILPVPEMKKRGRKPKAAAEPAPDNQGSILNQKDHQFMVRTPTPTPSPVPSQTSLTDLSRDADSMDDPSSIHSSMSGSLEEQETSTFAPENVSKSDTQMDHLKPEPKKRGRPSISSKLESNSSQTQDQAQLNPGTSVLAPEDVLNSDTQKVNLKPEPKKRGRPSLASKQESSNSLTRDQVQLDPGTSTSAPADVSKSDTQVDNLQPEPKKRGRPSLSSKLEFNNSQIEDQAQLDHGANILAPADVSNSDNQIGSLKLEPKKRGRPSLASKQESSNGQTSDQAQIDSGMGSPSNTISKRPGKQRLLVKHVKEELLLTPDSTASLSASNQVVKKKAKKSSSSLGQVSQNSETSEFTPQQQCHQQSISAEVNDSYSSVNQMNKNVENGEKINTSVSENDGKTLIDINFTVGENKKEHQTTNNSHHTEVEMKEADEAPAPTAVPEKAKSSTITKFQPVIKSADIFKVPSPKVDLKSAAEILRRLSPANSERSQLKKSWGRRSTLLKQDNIGETLSIGETIAADSDQLNLSEKKKDVIVFNSVLEPIIDPIHSAPNPATNPIVDPVVSSKVSIHDKNPGDSSSTSDMTIKAEDFHPGHSIHSNFSKRAASLDTSPGVLSDAGLNKRKRGRKPMLLKQTKIEKSISFQDVLSEPHLVIKDDVEKSTKDIPEAEVKSPEAIEIAPIKDAEKDDQPSTSVDQIIPDEPDQISRKRKQEDLRESETEENCDREKTPSPNPHLSSKRKRKPTLKISGSTSSSSVSGESRSTTPDSEYDPLPDSDQMFDDLDDDIPLLTISPKKPKAIAPSLPKSHTSPEATKPITAKKSNTKSKNASQTAPASSQNAAISSQNVSVSPINPDNAPTRGRSLRHKRIINYALLEDGRSLSESSDYETYEFDISKLDKPMKEIPPYNKCETDSSKLENIFSTDSNSSKSISKRRRSDSSPESVPLAGLKISKKTKKKSSIAAGEETEITQAESYVNLQVSSMKEALDNLREQLKDSESRNFELEQKLITLTETNIRQEKELTSITCNASIFEKELSAQKKRYDTDLEEFESAKTNLVALYNAIRTKSAEISQIKVYSERISLESEKLKKEIESSNAKIQALTGHKEHISNLRETLQKVFRLDSDSNPTQTRIVTVESLTDAECFEIVSQLLFDFVDTKKSLSMEIQNSIKRLKAKNDDLAKKRQVIKTFEMRKNEIIQEKEKQLKENLTKIEEKEQTISELKTNITRLEACSLEVEHLKKDRTKNISKLQEMKKEMNGKEFEHVKTIQKLAKEMGSMKEQVKNAFVEKDRQITGLNSKLREKETELANLKTDLEAKEKQVAKLESGLAVANQNKNEASREKMMDEIKWAREHCLEMDAKVRVLENEIKIEKDLNSSLKKTSEARVEELVQQLKEAEERLQLLKNKHRSADTVNQAAAEENESLKKVNAEYKNSLEELTKRCQTEIKTLETLLSEKKEEIENLKQKVLEYSLQLDVENLVRSGPQNIRSHFSEGSSQGSSQDVIPVETGFKSIPFDKIVMSEFEDIKEDDDESEVL